MSVVEYCHDLSLANAPLVVLKTVKDASIAANELKVMRSMAENCIEGVSVLIDTLDDGRTLVFPSYRALKPCKSLDLSTVAQYTRQIAAILTDIHSIGLVHLDLSPSNILMDSNDAIVLIDWGFARFIQSDSIVQYTNNAENCTGSNACGTPGYIAPEVYACQGNVSTPADIYSFGVILGQWLDIYIPDCSLNYLGSKLVRHPTTSYICKKIDEMKALQKEGVHPLWRPVVANAADLLASMLRADPAARISAAGILSHPFLCTTDAQFDDYTYANVSQQLLKRSVLGARSSRANASSYTVYYRGK